jgi:hypothetical protein
MTLYKEKYENGKSVLERTILILVPRMLQQRIIMFYNILLVSSYSFMCSSYITLFLYVHKYSDGCDAVFVYEGGS